jgi:hypothetical protein
MPFQAHRAPGSPLTQNQMQHLLYFLKRGCVARDHALSIYELGREANPMVIGGLCDKGLALKRTTRSGRRQFTLYWLTVAGVKAARELQKAQPKRKRA